MVKLIEQKADKPAPELVVANNKTSSTSFDLKLIDQVRHLLKQHYSELTSGQEEVKYSREHYEHIMDEQHPETCWRYLVHMQMNVRDAFELMKQCLAFRHENQVETLRAKNIPKEFRLKAPIGITGRTCDGHDLVYAVGKNYRKPDGQTAKPIIREFILAILFEWDREHQHDMEQFTMAFDVSATTLRNIDLDFSAWLVSLRDQVPARIHAIYIIGIPFLMRPIIRLIISWLPEKYRRICFCCTWDSLFETDQPVLCLDQVPKEAGGQADDLWRLSPREAPWASDRYPADILAKVDESICFNTSPERLEELLEMQRKFDQQTIG